MATITIIKYSEILDNWGSTESSMKTDTILKVIEDTDSWSDDMRFYDSNHRMYFIDDLIGKTIKIGEVKLKLNEDDTVTLL